MTEGGAGHLSWRWVGRLRRWSLKLAVLAGSLLAFLGGCQILAWSPLFNLKRAEVVTDGLLEKREILHWGGVRLGQSLFRIDPREIQQRLESHPWVAGVWVERSFPNLLRITVQERRAVAKVIVEGNVYLADSSGFIYPSFDRPPQGVWLSLKGLKEDDLKNRPEACKKVVLEAIALASLMAHRGKLSIEEISVDPDSGLTLSLQDGPKEVLLGFGELSLRLERLQRILEHVASEGRRQEVVRIDLRHPKRATVKFRG